MSSKTNDAAARQEQVEMTSLTGKAEARGGADDNKTDTDGLLKPTASSTNPSPPRNPCGTACALASAYATYAFRYAPMVFWSIAVVCLIVPAYFLIADAFFNPTEKFGRIKHHAIDVQSDWFDSTMKDIDHWCLKGDNDSCRCEDPTHPAPRSEFRQWTNAHQGNLKIWRDLMDQGVYEPDVAFLGGTVVEKMDGRWFGNVAAMADDSLNRVAKIFDKHFSGVGGIYKTDDNEENDSLIGVALGIAGDTNQAVLWRILNGEMPDEADPKIWWLVLGESDLLRAQCSEEVVVLGVLRVVEEILKRKPDATVVVNSLFPAADLRNGMNAPTTFDLQRSFGGEHSWDKRERAKKGPRGGRGKVGGGGEGKPSGRDHGSPPKGFDPKPIPKNGANGKPDANFRPRKFGGDGQQQIPERVKKGGHMNKKMKGDRKKAEAENGGGGNDRHKRRNLLHQGRRKTQSAKERPQPNWNGALKGRAGGGTGEGLPLKPSLVRPRGAGDSDFKTLFGDSGGVKKRNKVLRDRASQRKYNPITRKENKLPLWTSIKSINDELENFCKRTEGVYFFNADKYFTDQEEGKTYVKTEFLTPRGLLTDMGFGVWESAVSNYVRYLLKENEDE